MTLHWKRLPLVPSPAVPTSPFSRWEIVREYVFKKALKVDMELVTLPLFTPLAA